MKHTFAVETISAGKWAKLFSDSYSYCLGYLNARRYDGPRSAYRLIRSDGKVLLELPSVTEVSIGMIASYPTAEQYEHAANLALAKAALIRSQQQRIAK